MRKIIFRMLIFILIGSFITGGLSGCTYVEIGGGQGDETAEMIAVETVGRPVKPDSKQAVAITEHLEQLSFDREVDAVTMESKINLFRSGGSPLHVRLDPNIFYFICGYYDSTHENETEKYCCAPKYTWIEYASEKDILEHYDGKKLVVAFQINKPIEVVDVLERKPPSSFEHFQIYEPTFKDGVNIGKPEELEEESFIYLNMSDDLSIYHSVSGYSHSLVTIPCVYLDGQYYVTLELDGTKSHEELMQYEFGAYSETFSKILDTEKYAITDEQGQIHRYGIFKIENFMNEVSKIVSKDRFLAQIEADFEAKEGVIEIKADIFANIFSGSTSLPLPASFTLKVSDDDVYVYKNNNEQLIESVVFAIYPDLGDVKDVTNLISRRENYENKCNIVKKIFSASSGYLLTSSSTGLVFVYIVDGDYYILTLFGNKIQDIFVYEIGG